MIQRIPPCDLRRRRFVQGVALSGAAAALGLHRSSAAAAAGDLPMLAGTEFDLDIGELPVNFTGTPRIATAINGSLPGPLLRWREGSEVTLRVTNRLKVQTSLHWHGIVLPASMDGVPGFSFPGIAPGETFVYRFAVKQSGTYWYHSHSRFQEQTGLFAPLIIDPVRPDPIGADREHVILLADWSDEDPEAIYAALKRRSDFYNIAQPTAAEFFRDARNAGVAQAFAKRRMWNRMRMSPADLSDVSGATYTYLMNGATPAGNWTGLFRPGERVRLRFINASASTLFDVRIPGLKLTVVAADGQPVAPVDVDEFRIATAETYDVIVQPDANAAFTIFAQAMDRSGYARGTLAPRAGMEASVPPLDPRVPLSAIDLMGRMGESHAMDGGMDVGTDHAGMDHNKMSSSMPGMHHGAMAMPSVRHARSEYGYTTDMRIDFPRTNLDDPGVGLRDNGRRVLTYADLHTLGGSLYGKAPDREIELHLTGNMERFVWSFDGEKFSDAKPVHLRYGERVRIVLVNDTMMTHPIHLHGMWSEVETPQGEFLVRKHTVSVQPAQRVTYLVSADARGHWAYHCHLLYHMEAGMFREVVVA
ncbi:MAG TPA: copper resistance system multicopper oxidase [Rudaea sp.]